MAFATISWQPEGVVMIDQTRLPSEEVYVTCGSYQEVAAAIKTMIIRGAPAIGVAAAMGVALGIKRHAEAGGQLSEEFFQQVTGTLAATRPTAVNLFWALGKMRLVWEKAAASAVEPAEMVVRLVDEACRLYREDIVINQRLGSVGAEIVPPRARVLTHCNAGALACAGYGTALGVIRAAHAAGKIENVLADETRPLLQGARLTAWELQRDGIPVTVISDNMAAACMAQGMVDLVVVGADRIAANGDTANKIGTYGVALLARAHQIPFYIAAPCSTIDCSLASGNEIPIEERAPEEIGVIGTRQMIPAGVPVYNPAFDVTPAALIAGIITEKGIFPPSELTAVLQGKE
ncbi:MAG: S-methyl-5-thioribose-1-phosphate isomerase [Deltaproteobacteria bacterium]|nr:S-methyl-5-thioribose-1-phosphate isomerase [Candidatus Anaeroferrophillus wilburensis]MBN2889225.1 S-methyl-5-thioribose-1-phosphate isomerase [Deltaproteobacteria bacterium]